jgi:drug/metabolite transporter (DMT)-like permease
LSAGLLNGANSIFATRALRRQPPLTVVTYGVLFGSLFLLPIGAIAGTPVAAFAPPPAAWPALLYLSLISTVGASGMYVGALNRIEAGRASILATLEPVVAASIGVAVFGERLDAWQLFGGALVLAAGLVVTAGARRSRGRARGG